MEDSKAHMTNPSVLDARALDEQWGGRASYIVYFGGLVPEPFWILEDTATGQTLKTGGLAEMLSLVGSAEYPHSRRATWAEDMLRTRLKIFESFWQYPELTDHVVAPLDNPTHKR